MYLAHMTNGRACDVHAFSSLFSYHKMDFPLCAIEVEGFHLLHAPKISCVHHSCDDVYATLLNNPCHFDAL